MPKILSTLLSSLGVNLAAIKPRDAASLLLYRVHEGNYEVLMGRRPGKSRFMPDVYVFPGGAVDTCDARAKPSSTLIKPCVEHMAVGGSSARAQTIAMAAVRETYEETGLLIGRPGNPGAVQDATWQSLGALGVSADLSAIRYFARATTPADQPIRFNARFFVCDSAQVENLDTNALKQNDELLDLRWVPIDNPEALPLRSVTKFLLQELNTYLHQPDQWQGYPMFTQRGGKRIVLR